MAGHFPSGGQPPGSFLSGGWQPDPYQSGSQFGHPSSGSQFGHHPSGFQFGHPVRGTPQFGMSGASGLDQQPSSLGHVSQTAGGAGSIESHFDPAADLTVADIAGLPVRPGGEPIPDAGSTQPASMSHQIYPQSVIQHTQMSYQGAIQPQPIAHSLINSPFYQHNLSLNLSPEMIQLNQQRRLANFERDRAHFDVMIEEEQTLTLLKTENYIKLAKERFGFNHDRACEWVKENFSILDQVLMDAAVARNIREDVMVQRIKKQEKNIEDLAKTLMELSRRR